jgi:hypothetical protein
MTWPSLSAGGAGGAESAHGQVLALVGGRNYGTSQLNHAVAQAAHGLHLQAVCLCGGVQHGVEGTMLPGQTKLFSPVTMLSDEQTTYDVGNQEYTPRNYEGEYHDQVTARYALQRSLNNATIGLARWWASIAWRRWRARRASRARAARRRWRSARMTRRRWIWRARTRSSPTAACISTRGCWPACAPLRAT